MRNHEKSHVPPMSEPQDPTKPRTPTRPRGTDMTKVQAAYLQAAWNQLGTPLCEHLKVDLERSEDCYATGNYRCLACSHAVSH